MLTHITMDDDTFRATRKTMRGVIGIKSQHIGWGPGGYYKYNILVRGDGSELARSQTADAIFGRSQNESPTRRPAVWDDWTGLEIVNLDWLNKPKLGITREMAEGFPGFSWTSREGASVRTLRWSQELFEYLAAEPGDVK